MVAHNISKIIDGNTDLTFMLKYSVMVTLITQIVLPI